MSRWRKFRFGGHFRPFTGRLPLPFSFASRQLPHRGYAPAPEAPIRSIRADRSHEQGVALILTLSLLALSAISLTIFLVRAISAEKLASRFSDANLGEIQLDSVTALILKDLQQEIRAGSLPLQAQPPYPSPSLWMPATPRSHIPFPAGKHPQLPPNLLKQSASGVPFFSSAAEHAGQAVFPQAGEFPPSCRASGISTTTPGRDGRFVSPARWNLPALLPRKKRSSVHEMTPAGEGAFDSLQTTHAWKWAPPDWILVQNNGEQPTAWSRSNCWQLGSLSSVSHRFAYQIYDIGGLLDLNVAGCATSLLPAGSAARRGHCGLADLTCIGFPSTGLSKLFTWRNGATLAQNQEPPFAHPYLNFLFCGPINQGFIRAASYPGGASGRQTLTNRGIVSRKHLIQLVLALADGPQKNQAFESLQYLTHFSRALEQPSFRHGTWNPLTHEWERPLIVPPAAPGDLPYHPQSEPREILLCKNYRGGNDAAGGDAVINPAILEIRVQKPFRRNSSLEATPGEPLVNTRFPLSRIRWITPKGPSASLPPQDPRYCPEGTPEAIHASFGLIWNPAELCWRYQHGFPTDSALGQATHIGTLSAVANAGREADFFELLKASITAGSLGKAAAIDHPGSLQDPATPCDSSSYQQQRDRSLDVHILQIGANLIDQYDTDHFPTLLSLQNRVPNAANPHPKAWVVRGIEDLPYFHRLHLRGVPNAEDTPNPLPPTGCPWEITDSLESYRFYQCGTTSLLALPEIWNPHAASLEPKTGEFPAHFRCVAVSEDPEGFCPIGSSSWASENRFKIRPSTAFAGVRHPNDAAAIWFTHDWPESGGPPSLSNDLAASCGFWVDLFQNSWAPGHPPKDLYSVYCYPFFCL
ncbi:MAG: hypothetical protein RLZZ399_761, partial [Verrucomicrobiota bacterium]